MQTTQVVFCCTMPLGRVLIGANVVCVCLPFLLKRIVESSEARNCAKEMVLIVHGFLNEITALQFEWAWQKPCKSRRLKHIARKKKSQSQFEYKVSILTDMLRCGPWNRLPLTVRWLKQEYQLNFDPLRLPPVHMPTAYGPVVSKTVAASQEVVDTVDRQLVCAVCQCHIQATSNTLQCLRPDCHMYSHTLCLARLFLSDSKDQLLPVDGQCPSCHTHLLWGDLIRFKLGCYRNNLSQAPDTDNSCDTWTQELQDSQT